MNQNIHRILPSTKHCEVRKGWKGFQVFLHSFNESNNYNSLKINSSRLYSKSINSCFSNEFQEKVNQRKQITQSINRTFSQELFRDSQKDENNKLNDGDNNYLNNKKFQTYDIKSIRIGEWEMAPYNAHPSPNTPIKTKITSLIEEKSIVEHLKWMLQKISMGQDMLLIGPPGSLKRRLAFEVARILNAEVEYVSITRDINESDLKQRREIESKSAKYVDQCVVRAALQGKILILDGLERAERNLLPILNNLLENREMALEDGRLLIRYERWKDLLNKNQNLSDKIVPVHPNFRVIGISIPVPPFQGNPLDPPLRSRFQACEIHEEDLVSLIQLPESSIPWDTELISLVLELLQSISKLQISERSNNKSIQLPPFSVSHAEDLLIYLHESRSYISKSSILEWLKILYPIENFSKDRHTIQTVHELFEKGSEEIASYLQISLDKQTMNSIKRDQSSNDLNTNDLYSIDIEHQDFSNLKHSIVSCTLSHAKKKLNLSLIGGLLQAHHLKSFVPNGNQQKILQNMFISHKLNRDICIIGERGSGKSLLAKQFASLLGYEAVVLPCFQDMTSRDLLLSRSTDSNGNTIWRESSLIQCMRNGKICILESVHNLDRHVLLSIQSLIQDRELFLPDGSRWVNSESYQLLIELGYTEEELSNQQIYKIHPSFRIIAISALDTQKQQWFSAETVQLFHFHTIPKLTIDEEFHLICNKIDKIREKLNTENESSITTSVSVQNDSNFTERIYSLLRFKHAFNTDIQAQTSKKVRSISLREILRLALAIAEFPNDVSLAQAIYQMTMIHFLPQKTRTQILNLMKQYNITNDSQRNLSIEVENGYVRIGGISSPQYKSSNPALVPKPFFVDTEEHLKCMQVLLFDHVLHEKSQELGYHSLLIGNQGVGKNVLTYALLNNLNKEMEYMQLHRDITVHSLTVQPTVMDGVIQYTDSPLVRAVQHGRTLLLDEADKCPLEIVSIIRSLLADGDMTLSDGRRIIRLESNFENNNNAHLPSNIIPIHPDFRVIVLANRPGYPFHGENFFGECGDLFQTQYVDNPSGENTLKMLKSYAPSVNEEILLKLISCFDDLRQLNFEGVIQYPYSTRELVSISKHLQFFPRDGISKAVSNVVSFDRFNTKAFQHLRVVFERHGIPLQSISNYRMRLSPSIPIVLTPKDKIHFDTIVILNSDNIISKEASLDVVDFQPKSEVRGSSSQNHRLNEFMEHKQTLEFPEFEVEQIVSLKDGSLHGWIQRPSKEMISFHPPLYGKFTRFDMSSLRFMTNVHISAYENKIIIFGTSFLQGGSSLLDRRTVLYFFLFDPKAMQFDGYVAFPIQSRYSEKYFCTSNKSGNELTVWGKDCTEFHKIIFNGNQVLQKTFNLGIKIQSLQRIGIDIYLVQSLEDQYIVRVSNQIDIKKLSSSSSIVAYNEINAKQEFTSVDSKGQISLVIMHDNYLQRFESEVTNNLRIMLPNSCRNDCILGETLEKDSYLYINMDQRLALKLISATENESMPILSASEINSGTVATVHQDRKIRIWDINSTSLIKEASFWKTQIADTEANPRIEFQYHGKNTNLRGPKHGKEDNKPHVGGNTFAGGTGGRDTAGLGGIGGPYRLDKGHNVYQLPDSMKKKVDKEALERARQMGKEAFKKRLEEIEMSEVDLSIYQKFLENVQPQINHLRELLENLRAKEQDRIWVKGQTHGELDEGKVIEAITGETGIYKRRSKKEDVRGFFMQKKPKILRFLVDVSGSMYRFNGTDKRLTRMMELAVLLMESLDGFDHKYKYEIVGHSGESRGIQFVKFDNPPSTQKERLKVIMRMHAHSQFCMSGDSTIEATYDAIKSAAEEEVGELDEKIHDESFVFCFSDANLARYGISAKEFGSLLISEVDKVKAFAIFLAGFGDEAERSVKEMPEGYAYICKDTSLLSKMFEDIFTSHVIDN